MAAFYSNGLRPSRLIDKFAGTCSVILLTALLAPANPLTSSQPIDFVGFDKSNTPEGEYYRGGRLPSPAFRSHNVSLNRSVFERDRVILANANSGHTFGDRLTNHERSAVIKF